MQAHLPAGFCAWHLQPLVWFGAALARPRFYATRAIADLLLRDRLEKDRGVRDSHAGETMAEPFGPQLHRMLEAQLTRMHAGLQRRLSHQKADQIVGEQVDPQLLLAHRRSLTTQHLQSQSVFDVAQIELYIPSALVKLPQLSFAHAAWIEHRGHQHAAADADLAHEQFCGRRRVFVATSTLVALWASPTVRDDRGHRDARRGESRCSAIRSAQTAHPPRGPAGGR